MAAAAALHPSDGYRVGVDMYLFDLDGTLSDSGQAIFLSLNEALTDCGFAAIDRRDLPRFVGPPLEPSIARHLEEHDQDPSCAPDVIESYRRSYRQLSIAHASLFPGIREMLERLDGPFGVVTSKPMEFSAPLIAELGLLDRLAVIGAPDGSESEPKRITLRRALMEVGSDPAHTVMIGDRHHDIEAGLHEGTVTMGVTWGFGDRLELERAGAHRVIDQPTEIA